MNSLEIRIRTRKLMDYSASLKRTIDDKTLLMMIKSFSEYVMNLYGMLIEESINSNRYKGLWEPIEEEGYKEYLGTEPTGDILFYIKDAFEVKKIGYDFIIRINPRKKYPGSKVPLYRVVLAIDNGTSKFNARPILKKIINQINHHMLDLWRGFLKMKGVI
jgi:hypothetical protein